MSTTTINIKIDAELKELAAELAEEFGMSLGTMTKVLLKQAVRKKSISLDARTELFPPEQMTPEMARIIGEFEAERRAGTLETISHDEFMRLAKEDIAKNAKRHARN